MKLIGEKAASLIHSVASVSSCEILLIQIFEQE